jgi:uncharacterized OB-fold protein
MAGDEQMVQSWPLPAVHGTEDEGFWSAARDGVLVTQECTKCGRLRHPPRPMCPSCRSTERGWRTMSGRGRVWSFTVPHPPLLPVFAELAPYNVVVVELDEDPTIRLVGNIVPAADAGPDGISAIDPAAIRIGAPVRAVFTPMADDVTLVQWVLDESPGATR